MARAGTHDEVEPPDPGAERAGAELAGPGDVDDVEGPLDDAGAGEVLAGGEERAGRGVAPGRADALEVAREEDGGDERERVHPEGGRGGAQRGAVEEEAEEERERAGREEAEAEVLDRLGVLLCWRGGEARGRGTSEGWAYRLVLRMRSPWRGWW